MLPECKPIICKKGYVVSLLFFFKFVPIAGKLTNACLQKFRMISVSGLFIYPIKSLGGISLPFADTDGLGLQHDRRWMLVNAQGRFMTQREYPAMAQLLVQQVSEGFRVYHHANNHQSIVIPAHAMSPQQLPVQVWNDQVTARLVDAAIDHWFSTQLQVNCRLVRLGPESQRIVDQQYAPPGATTGFADGFPVLLIGQASLDDLNQRLPQPVPMNRFRPNVVVSGCGPFAEDHWVHVQVGSTRLRVAKPCSRCVMTTIAQPLGTPAGPEPLRTLAAYRSSGNRILFGQNVLITQPGRLAVGDEVQLPA
jgi:uncharacterized protein